MRLFALIPLLIISSLEGMAQNAYFKLGYQSFMDKDFKTAVQQLEKACKADSNNTNALWMLGYSYYHSDNYKKSVATYSRVILLTPTDVDAYYFRSKAKSNMAKDAQLSYDEREKCMLGAISDMNRALIIKPGDMRNYQTRGLAYRDYAQFKLQPNTPVYDRSRGMSALKAEVADFEKILADNPGRNDISTLLDAARDKMTALYAHH